MSERSGLPRSGDAGIDGRVLAFACVISLLSIVGFALIPALRATRGDLRPDLGSGRRQAGGSRGARQVGAVLIALEVALALVVVSGAGLLLSSLHALRSVDSGLDTEHVLAVELAPPDTRYRNARSTQYYADVTERLAAIPGVTQAWTSLFQVFLMLAIPFSLPRTFGRMVGDRRQGYAILAVMGLIFLVSLSVMSIAELGGGGAATHAAGAAMEGKEVRFGILGTTLFGTTSTATSTGAVNGMFDSFTPIGGMMAMLNMMLGEVTPGGVGVGLYGMLVLAVITVFIGGLLVGRTPEYLGKKIRSREMTFAALYILVTPTVVLLGTALSLVIPGVREQVLGTSVFNPGNHGLSELLYAFTSAGNNNGSAFGGLTANTTWMNSALGVAMLLGRFVPMVFVLALAGSLASQDKVPETVGTLPTHRPLFIGLLAGVAVIVTALTYFPVLALGPLAEGLSPSDPTRPARRWRVNPEPADGAQPSATSRNRTPRWSRPPARPPSGPGNWWRASRARSASSTRA